MTMIIRINRDEKIVLLKALKDGFIDTDKIPALKKLVDEREPARFLTKQEARELLNKIENEC